MTDPNFTSKTVWTGDNLDILRGMNSECVDLIYLDPPFNSNRNYAAPVGSKAAGAAFKDTWTLSPEDDAWLTIIAESQPSVGAVVQTARAAHGKGMQSYLTMMAIRLIEMRRVLKETGSIYIHCDPTASHYLKLLMDAVFGASRFRNEVVWKRTAGRSDAKRFGRVHDVLLFYAGSGATWNRQYTKHDPTYVVRAYRNKDERGHWQSADLTANGPRSGESGKPWRGIDPGKVGRHWSTPTQGGMNDYIVEHGLISGWPDKYPGVHSRLDAIDVAGLIAWPKSDGMPRLKRYLVSTKGTAVEDIFADIGRLEANSKEKVGYPTQKPLALLERIIKASSNEGDVVLDPFCGCATACVAAESLGRLWVGIDLSAKASELTNERLQQAPPLGIGSLFHHGYVTTRSDVPRRTDLGKLPPYQTHKPALYGKQGGDCAGCRVHFLDVNLTVDHIIPQAKGGTDHIENLQLLCGHCNSTKGSKPQEYLIARLRNLAVLA